VPTPTSDTDASTRSFKKKRAFRQSMDDFQQTVKLKVKSFGQKRLLREKLKEVEEQVLLTTR
jgi:hypothetical protein